MSTITSRCVKVLLLLVLCGALFGCPRDVRGPASISASPDNLTFAPGEDTKSLTVFVSGAAGDLRLEPAVPWIVLSETRIPSPSRSNTVTVTVDRCRMPAATLGANTASIVLKAQGASSATVAVSADVDMVVDFTASNRRPGVGAPVQFTASAALPEGHWHVDEWLWDFGDGSEGSTERDPVHQYDTPGIYTVSVFAVADGLEGCRTRLDYITVPEPGPEPVAPAADFTVSTQAPAVNESVSFIDLSDPGSDPITQWQWDFGDGATSSMRSPSHAYTTEGTFAVSLTVTTEAGTDTEVKTDYITTTVMGPHADFVASTRGPIAGQTAVQFGDRSRAGTSPITAWAWDFGDGATSTLRNPTHVYANPGTYTVTLSVTTAQGSDTEVKEDYITAYAAPPDADFRASPTRGTTLDDIQFTDLTVPTEAAIAAWTWDFGDGSAPATAANPVHRYDAPGTYTVTMTIETVDGLTASRTRTSYITIFESTMLDELVRDVDPVAGPEGAATQEEYFGGMVYYLRLVSQQWRSPAEVSDPTWRHWVTIVVPFDIQSATAVLMVAGGDNTDSPPAMPPEELLAFATASGTVVAVIENVPNQPLAFTGEPAPLSGDDLVAYTLGRYLDGYDADDPRNIDNSSWPLLVPMAESIVRGMDTIQDFLGGSVFPNVVVSDFWVTGGSTQAWAAWLAAATDGRVSAVAPLAFDALNLDAQMAHQLSVYGFYSEALAPFETYDVLDRLDSDAGQALLALVDPHDYRQRLTMPKFIVNATGDEYWTPDSARFYYADLPAPKYLRYVPNADHSLGGYTEVAAGLAGWFADVQAGRTLPQAAWSLDRGSLRVTSQSATPPLRVRLWQATSPYRDFRLDPAMNPGAPVWTQSVLLPRQDGSYRAEIQPPAVGWTGFFAELVYSADGDKALTTEVGIVPDVASPKLRPGFTADKTTPRVGEPVAFTNTTFLAGASVLNVEWRFGDGIVSNMWEPVHVYDEPGTYTVQLAIQTTMGGAHSVRESYITAVKGYQTAVGEGEDEIDVVVAYGSPGEMGHAVGALTSARAASNIRRLVDWITNVQGVSGSVLDGLWSASQQYQDIRFREEVTGLLSGVNERGEGVTFTEVTRAQMVPALARHTGGATAAWGAASDSGDLLQSHTLQWDFEVGIQDNPLIVVYLPDEGRAHVTLGFAGLAGAFCGLNDAGIAVSSVGLAPEGGEILSFGGHPYNSLVRRVLYDGTFVDDSDVPGNALHIVQSAAPLGRYYYVLGDGVAPDGVKVRVSEPDGTIDAWFANDGSDPVTGEGLGVFPGIVYHAGDRNANVFNHLASFNGSYDGPLMLDLARVAAGGTDNLMNVVFDASTLDVWVAYARRGQQADERDPVYFNLAQFLP